MANLDNPSGFLPYDDPDCGGGNAPIKYMLLRVDGTAINLGDPLTISSGRVQKAAAGNALCGIAAEYKTGIATGRIAVWADPSTYFVAQTDNGTGTLTDDTGIGLNADFVAGGSPTNKRSNAEIDESTGAATATLPFKVIDISDEISNAYGQFNRLVVRINNHQLQSGTGTAGS